jgi:hypothetical protein
MDEYYLLIIILTILMLFYGGVNKISQIEYDYTYFKSIHNIRLFKNYLLKNNSKENIDLLSKTKNISIIINNLEHLEYVNIEPFQYYINNKMYDKSLLMIIYTVNNDFNKLQVVIDKLDNKQFLNYNVSNDIFITNPYVIYNNSNENTKFIVAFIKKPYWYY